MQDRLFGKPLVTQEELQKRVRELGAEIANEYADRDLLIVGVLKGAFAFVADLARAISLPLRVDFITVTTTGNEQVKIVGDLTEEIRGKDVLLVEDIVDSGHTVEYLRRTLLARRPKSLRVCTLLDKRERRKVEVTVDYVGFAVPDKYVVGYGLDYDNRYRNLPYIAVLPTIKIE